MVGDNATAYLDSILRPADVVLVKASCGGHLCQFAQALTGQPITGL
jgi:UDP-N-acetylmuramoyl-tripeptide--D-alanyl-D-alanine ligase